MKDPKENNVVIQNAKSHLCFAPSVKPKTQCLDAASVWCETGFCVFNHRAFVSLNAPVLKGGEGIKTSTDHKNNDHDRDENGIQLYALL